MQDHRRNGIHKFKEGTDTTCVSAYQGYTTKVAVDMDWERECGVCFVFFFGQVKKDFLLLSRYI